MTEPTVIAGSANQVEALVTKIEDLLVQARMGKIQALAYVTIGDDHEIAHGRVEFDPKFERDLVTGIGDLFFACHADRECQAYTAS